MLSPNNPFSVSANFRAFAYSKVILAFETNNVLIKASNYSKKTLDKELGLYVLNKKKLSEIQNLEKQQIPHEHLVFYTQGKGYECLFKRLRDTFAHGHYSSPERRWIKIRHRFKGPRDKVEQTRIFGNLKINTLKNLIDFLNENHSDD